MPWSSHRPERLQRLSLIFASAGAISILAALLVIAAPEEKHVSVYSSAANYSLAVLERGGQDYVGLLETLEPLGSVSAKSAGNRWKLRYNNVEGEFTPGKTRARVRGSDVDLPARFLLEDGRGLVPVASLSTLLPRFLGGPVTFHESSRRMFIGNVAIHFTAQIGNTNPPALVMEFTSPVNPTISTEPGKVRMVFSREAVVPPGTETLTFDSKTIPSARYEERNGSAEVVVNGTVPLFASFSNNGKTITIAPAPQTAATTAEKPSGTPAGVPNSSGGVSSAQPSPVPARYFAVIDASHGGDERGEALTPSLSEKDVTLAYSRRLRQELESRGLTALLVRDGDTTLNLDQRADVANTTRPLIYLCFHASSQGQGVRLYTAVLPASGDDRGPFLDFDRAQFSYRATSQIVAGGLSAELQKKQIGVRTLLAPLRPLNNIAGAAIAIEVAPPSSNVADLNSPAYQQLVASSIAAAVATFRDKLEAGR